MRHYECECTVCGHKTQILFPEPPYPEIGDHILNHCKMCSCQTEHIRVLTRKAAAEERRNRQEAELQRSIMDSCDRWGLSCRFVHQSVVITTPLADWSFDYHQSRITLYHESTVKINFDTGNYSKTHTQFENRKMRPEQVIDYIAKHDQWRAGLSVGNRNKNRGTQY